MAPTNAGAGMLPSGGDDLDDLFDYDPRMDDVFKDMENNNTAGQQELGANGKQGGSEGLGIDEEVKLVKKRQPVAKLDESRLLSGAGIPKLRKISKDRLKFRGKGHEFSDVARLLNMYQLWLDDLYPRAKFADGLTIIEKLGHSKRMQVMRKQWIGEGKPRPTVEEDVEVEQSTEKTLTASVPREGEGRHSPARRKMEDREAESNGTRNADTFAAPANKEAEPDDDELDALLAEDSMQAGHPNNSLFGSGTGLVTNRQKPAPPGENEFADEEEAMAGLDDMW